MNCSEIPGPVLAAASQLETPWFLYDIDRVRHNIERLHRALHPVKLFYAVKSNSLPAVLSTAAEMGCGFEINTMRELQKAEAAGALPEEMINSAPVKLPREIAAMYTRGVRQWVFDSRDEIEKLAAHAPGSDVLIRLHTSNQDSAFQLNKKFGVPLHHADELIELARRRGLNPAGVTFHVGSQCLNLSNWVEGIEMAARLFQKHPGMTVLDIGGGFPVQYSNGMLEVEEIGRTVRTTISREFPLEPHLIAEPGRVVTGNAAITGATVIGTRDGDVTRWAYVDIPVFGGLLELLEDPDEFRYFVETPTPSTERTLTTIAGPSCDGCDILLRNVVLPVLERGDRLFFRNTGAYSLDYASRFNGYDIPKCYFIRDGKLDPNGYTHHG